VRIVEKKLFIIPKKPFDGKMRKLRLVIAIFGAMLIAALMFLTSFIYYYAIQFLHYTPLLLLGPTFIAEIMLLYFNNEARVKYKRYFMELNPIWSKVDTRSPEVSMLGQFFLVMGLATALLLFQVEFFFFMFGVLVTDLLLDYVTVSQRIQCVKLRCPNLTKNVVCLQCLQTDGTQKCPFNVET
jgi:hypothetical protein